MLRTDGVSEGSLQEAQFEPIHLSDVIRGHGGDGLVVAPGDLSGLYQPQGFYDLETMQTTNLGQSLLGIYGPQHYRHRDWFKRL